jgi:anthranilate/para-aminobenzoate synthase component II
MARILVIDSYDSFVYNIVQYLGELGAEPVVVRNDQLTVDEAVALAPDGVLLSPGPGRPEEAGIICDAIRAFAGNVKMSSVSFGYFVRISSANANATFLAGVILSSP